MCGIVFISREQKPAAKNVWKKYNEQKTRGAQGFGYIAINQNKIAAYQRNAKEDNIKKRLEEETASTILFHHRYPTSTANFKETAHPIKIENAELDHTYYVVHNGIISNDDTLKKQHEKIGYTYNTLVRREWITSGDTYVSEEYNDSEAVAIELARLIDGKSDKVNALGSYAFIVAQVNRKGNVNKIYYGTNGGKPLKMKNANAYFSLTSEGEGKEIEAGRLYSFDLRKRIVSELEANIGKIEYKNENIGFKYDTSASLGLYDDEYNVGSELEELDWDIQVLKERLDYARQVAKIEDDYSEVEEILLEIRDAEQERESIELEAGLKIK